MATKRKRAKSRDRRHREEVCPICKKEDKRSNMFKVWDIGVWVWICAKCYNRENNRAKAKTMDAFKIKPVVTGRMQCETPNVSNISKTSSKIFPLPKYKKVKGEFGGVS